MKRVIFLLILVLTFNFQNGFSQATSSDPSSPAPGPNQPFSGNDYLGWDVNTLQALDIMHQANYPINFYTNGTISGASSPPWDNLRMIIYEDPQNVSAANAGFVGIGHAIPPRHLTLATLGNTGLIGVTPSMVELLVAGGITGDNSGRQTVADFQSINDNSNSIGIRIRGSRNVNHEADCAYIDFDNYYVDGTTDMKLARISADAINFSIDDAAGYLRIRPADVNSRDGSGYNTAVFCNYNGQVGIGLDFSYSLSIFPNTRLEVLDAEQTQLRLTNDYVNDIYTNFYTHTDGNLLINPLNSATAKNVGIGLTTSTLPTQMLDVLGNGRFRGLNTGTNDYIVTAETNGTLHHLAMSTAGNVLHGDGTWSPAGDVTSCGGGISNYVAKFTSATVICKSSIWENSSSPFNVGIGTTTPFYKLHNCTTAMFSNAALAAALTQYVSKPYPLAVESFNTGTSAGYAGLAVFGGSGSSNNDELNVFVDDDDITCFTNRGSLTNFYYEPTNPMFPNISMLGFNPVSSSTIIMDDFSISNPSAPVYTNTRFYVESQDHGNTIVPYAAWMNNNSNDNVASSASSYGLRAQSDSEHDQVNMRNIGAQCFGGNASTENIGIVANAYNTCTNCSTATSIGGQFTAKGPSTNYGVDISVSNNTSTNKNHTGANIVVANNDDQAKQIGADVLIWSYGSSSENIGYKVIIDDNNATTNQGAFIVIISAGSSTTEGIFARIPASGCTSSCTQFAGHFSGPLLCQSTPIYSDSILKQNINPIQNALTMLNSLSPKSYEFNTNAIPQMWLPAGGTHYGLIAQEVELFFPELVSNATEPALKDTAGNIIYPAKDFKALNYTEFIPMLIAAIKEQQVQIDTLNQRILSCCGIAPRPNGNSMNENNRQSIELKDIKMIILEQNVPNPFAEETDIRYTIPSTVKSAIIFIYDNAGNILKKVELNDRGESSLHIYAQDLSSGLYKYSLIVDGKVIETKTMVKSK